MAYGRLEMNVGPMFAGKTRNLIKEVLWQTYFSDSGIGDDGGPNQDGAYERESGTRVAIFKPAYDTRYDEEAIVSHRGEAIRARAISEWPDDLDGRYTAVFFDEIQFFSEPVFRGDVVAGIRALRHAGTDVFCSGLDMDFRGHAFEVTAALMAESTTINRLTALCDRCGAPASMTGRRTRDGQRLSLGSSDIYLPLCLTHWAERLPRSGE